MELSTIIILVARRLKFLQQAVGRIALRNQILYYHLGLDIMFFTEMDCQKVWNMAKLFCVNLFSYIAIA